MRDGWEEVVGPDFEIWAKEIGMGLKTFCNNLDFRGTALGPVITALEQMPFHPR